MSETYLGRYAALQKRSTVSAVLDFTDEESSRSSTTVADSTTVK